jgi:hypothetical protein
MEMGFDKAVVHILYIILPDLENFNFRTEVVHELEIPAAVFLPSLGYGLLYTSFLLFLAVAIFRKRDFI